MTAGNLLYLVWPVPHSYRQEQDIPAACLHAAYIKKLMHMNILIRVCVYQQSWHQYWLDRSKTSDEKQADTVLIRGLNVTLSQCNKMTLSVENYVETFPYARKNMSYMTGKKTKITNKSCQKNFHFLHQTNRICLEELKVPSLIWWSACNLFINNICIKNTWTKTDVNKGNTNSVYHI